MTEFLKKHKKSCTLIGIIAAVLVFAAYLYALFLPGYWYGDTFLYKKSELIFGELEVYSGYDAKNQADYEMTMIKDGKTTYMSFTVNENEKSYDITSDDSINHNPDVTIIENGEIIFMGTAKSGFLFNKNDELLEPPITITYDTDKPTEEELFPSYTWLYSVSQSLKTETRGEAVMLIFIAFFAAELIVDIAFPDFFWQLRHCLDVEGGEPSEFYRFGQKAMRVFMAVMIIGAMIFTFL